MKVVLEAFDKLRSEVMEWPDETRDLIHLPLRQQPVAIVDFFGNEIAHTKDLRKRATFVRTNRSYFIDGEPVEIYALQDIY